MTTTPPALPPDPGDRRRAVAKSVFDTLLSDQIGRGESLNAAAGVLAGLAGVVTTLAGTIASLTVHNVGLAGIAAAGLSVVLAIVGLLSRRPGREPVQAEFLLTRILETGDVTLTEDVLLYADAAAATRNDGRLRWKGWWTACSAIALAGAVILIVLATMLYGTAAN